MTRKRAFTLIELLLVISIIGILVGITTYAWSSTSKRSRDNTRRADLEKMRNLLQQYYMDNRQYPIFDSSAGTIFSAAYQLTDSGCGSAASLTKRIATKYTSTLPEDPLRKSACKGELKDNSNRYIYLSLPADSLTGPKTATGFALMTKLEGTTYDYTVADGFAGSDYAWYKKANNDISDQGYRAQANYVISGSYGR